MKLRRSIYVLLNILQIFCSYCKGNLWNKYLFLNETSLEYSSNYADSFDNDVKKKSENKISDNFSQQNYIHDVNDDQEYSEFNATSIIEYVEVIKATGNSLTILWMVKGDNVSTYSVEWSKGDKYVGNVSINSNSNSIEFTIEDLDPCTIYIIRVMPLGTAESKEVFGETSKMQPGAPVILTADPGKDKGILFLNISWNTPSIGSSCIKYYKVTVTTEIFNSKHVETINTSLTNAKIKNLCACTSYLVIVKAVDLNDEYGLAATIQSKPTLAKESNPPKLMNSINLPPIISTTHSITLNWNVHDSKNNCTINTVLTECNYSHTQGYGFKLKESGSSNCTMSEENSRVVRMTIENLSPFTKYLCWGWIDNSAGRSFPGIPVPIFTKQDVSSPPDEFQYVENSQFMFTWEAPRVMPGQLQHYMIWILWKPLYPVPSFCNVIRRDAIANISPSLNNYTWMGGEGYSDYTAYILAQTRRGWSAKSEFALFRSQFKGLPSKVTKFNHEIRPQKNDSNALETYLYWNLPCSLKGHLQYFTISVIGTREKLNNHSFTVEVYVSSDFQNNDIFNINLGELKPQYFYTFEIRAIIEESDEGGEVESLAIEYPAGIPPEPSISYIRSITLKHNKIQRTTTSFEILLPLFSDANGDVKYYAIIVSRLDIGYKESFARLDTQKGAWPNISSWRESMEKNFDLPYQASKPNWTPYPNDILDYGRIKAVKIVIGDDTTCKDISSKGRLYCNGPLNSDTWYEVRMRAFTNGGYRDSRPFVVKTDAEISVILIIGLVIAIFLIGMVLAFIFARKSYFDSHEKGPIVEETNDQSISRSRRFATNGQQFIVENSTTKTESRLSRLSNNRC